MTAATQNTQADWGGEELQHAEGWITNWAGDSPREPNASAETDTKEVLSAKDKKARRDFYTNFTDRALSKTGGEYKIDVEEEESSVKHEKKIAWHRWVDLRHRVPGASARLFCCSWAGGNSLAFERWPEQLPGVEVVPLLLPGRLTRAEESPIRDLPQLVHLAVEALCRLSLLAHEDIPYFILGHEFGALVAFEICRKVQADFPIRGLFVSSMSCPQMIQEREKVTLLCQDGEVLRAQKSEVESAMLRRGPPMPLELLENKDLLEIFTPLWLADLSALDTYEYESGTPLECPIYSFGGKKDGEQKMQLWAMESSSGESYCTLFEGGSFFFLDLDNEAEMLRTVGGHCAGGRGEASDQKTTYAYVRISKHRCCRCFFGVVAIVQTEPPPFEQSMDRQCAVITLTVDFSPAKLLPRAVTWV